MKWIHMLFAFDYENPWDYVNVGLSLAQIVACIMVIKGSNKRTARLKEILHEVEMRDRRGW